MSTYVRSKKRIATGEALIQTEAQCCSDLETKARGSDEKGRGNKSIQRRKASLLVQVTYLNHVNSK